MAFNRLENEGLTFDDILLIPAKSKVLPRETDIKTNLTTEIKLKNQYIEFSLTD